MLTICASINIFMVAEMRPEVTSVSIQGTFRYNSVKSGQIKTRVFKRVRTHTGFSEVVSPGLTFIEGSLQTFIEFTEHKIGCKLSVFKVPAKFLLTIMLPIYQNRESSFDYTRDRQERETLERILD